MKKALKISAIILGILLVIAVIGKLVLLDYSSVPDQSAIAPAIEDMRALAGTAGLPARINMLEVGSGSFMPGMVVAGDREKKYTAPFICYQVVYDASLPGGGNTVIVDTALDKSLSGKFSNEITIHEDNYNKLQAAMGKAAAIILTHEHFDHAGGIAKSPRFDEICGRVFLTDEQLASPGMLDAGFTGDMLARCKKVSYQGLHLLFPGMVLMKTPGHLPGHQVVYVKLKNGAEFLLAGDIAWHRDNIELLRLRPLLVSLFLKEDRANVADQTRWLHDEIYEKHKEVKMLVSHDLGQHLYLVKEGLLGGTFEL